MPSHTFTRLGYWQDSIDTNVLSAAAARKVNAIGEELHASDYQAYAYLQTGQDAAARRVVDSIPGILARRGPVSASAAPPAAATFAVAAIPARYALERGAWADAARLEPRATALPYADAMTWFARALGGARGGDLATAKAAVDELQKAIDRLTAREGRLLGGAGHHSEAGRDRMAGARGGQIRRRARRDARAPPIARIARRRAAITPGPLAPARELLGEMLLQLKQPKAALAEFEKTMAKEPNRFRAVAGAAAAAAQSGDRAASRKYDTQLLTICAKADTPGRPELQAARSAK